MSYADKAESIIKQAGGDYPGWSEYDRELLALAVAADTEIERLQQLVQNQDDELQELRVNVATGTTGI